MSILLNQPFSIFARGKRDHMEDCIFPPHTTATADNRYFIVCDGMGGHASGEIASKLACDSLADYFINHKTSKVTQEYLMDAFHHIEGMFDEYIINHPGSHGMGTTLVMLYLSSDKAAVMHCGDSRCYHIRGNEVLWRTQDHKLINDWVNLGLLSAKEAEKHPRSNVITRAIQGYSVLKIRPDLHFITGIKPGDYFFLCTDGINESLNDDQLCMILSSAGGDMDKISVIQMLCEGNSNDNHSAYLLNIQDVQNRLSKD